MLNDAEESLKLIIDQANARLDRQFSDGDAGDAKALGLAGADAAIIALMVATHDSLNGYWWLPTLLLGLAGLMSLVAVWPRRYDSGPDWREFYEKFGGGAFEDVGRQMLAELLAAIEANDKIDRSAYLNSSLFFMCGGLLGSLAVALVR